MLTSKQALRKIKVFYKDSVYSLHDDENGFYTDLDTDSYYSWRFTCQGQVIIISCDKATGKITVEETGKNRL